MSTVRTVTCPGPNCSEEYILLAPGPGTVTCKTCGCLFGVDKQITVTRLDPDEIKEFLAKFDKDATPARDPEPLPYRTLQEICKEAGLSPKGTRGELEARLGIKKNVACPGCGGRYSLLGGTTQKCNACETWFGVDVDGTVTCIELEAECPRCPRRLFLTDAKRGKAICPSCDNAFLLDEGPEPIQCEER